MTSGKREMAAFYSSPTDQTGAMPTLYLKEPRNGYLDPSAFTNGNMLCMNYPSGSYSNMLAGDSRSQQRCFDIPVSTTGVSLSHHSSMVEPASASSHIGETGYHVLRDGRNELIFIQSMSGTANLINSSVTDNTHPCLQRSFSNLNGQNLSLEHVGVSAVHGEGLSLSLGTQEPGSSQYPATSSDISILSAHQSTLGNDGSSRDDNLAKRPMHTNLSYATSDLMNVILNSKFLKPTQQLLDEVVNIHKQLKQRAGNSQSINVSVTTGISKSDDMPVKPQESTANFTSLTTFGRQDLQNKLTKLLAMLDEVDRRYKQYFHQMQIVVSSFDVITGLGAAKPYTALALRTISLQFRSLKDAISGQIKSTRSSLGEQDSSNSKGATLTRLRFIDQHLRQQKAIQQLGMFQQHSWRPQRGLPEASVSILRAWLFEHFLHPYPGDPEKFLLARQTGLTKSQISNWFINARVRLWKPMIEDIYKEEIGDTETDSNSSSENVSKGRDKMVSPMEREDLQGFTVKKLHLTESSKSNHSSNLGTGTSYSAFQNNAASDASGMDVKLREQGIGSGGSTLLHSALSHPEANTRFVVPQTDDLGKYGNSSVSLTLGLRHCEGSMFDAAPPLGSDVAEYECMNMAEQRQRFTTSHLLHDFVA